MSRSMRLVNGRRITLEDRTWGILEYARVRAGLPPGAAYPTQGGFNRGAVAASAGTHDGDAFDLSVRGLSDHEQLLLIWHLRRANCLAYVRAPKYGWPQPNNVHIHGIVKDAAVLSAGAKRQVRDYDLGLNGLASKRKDPHWNIRPKQYPIEQLRLLDLHPGKTIRVGTRNSSAVRVVQRRLGQKVDGWYGPATSAAVRRFQRGKWKFGNGLLGKKTYEAIVLDDRLVNVV